MINEFPDLRLDPSKQYSIEDVFSYILKLSFFFRVKGNPKDASKFYRRLMLYINKIEINYWNCRDILDNIPL